MVRFCEDEIGCRRKALLSCLDEQYEVDAPGSSARTGGGGGHGCCDNCKYRAARPNPDQQPVTRDMTTVSAQLLRLVVSFRQAHTLKHTTDVFYGAAHAKIRQLGHDKLRLHGVGGQLDPDAR